MSTLPSATQPVEHIWALGPEFPDPGWYRQDKGGQFRVAEESKLAIPGVDAAGQPVPPMPPAPGLLLYRINCGAMLGEGWTYRVGDAVWQQDQEWKEGRAFGVIGGWTGRRVAPIQYLGTDLPGVYRYERGGMDGYRFKVPNGTCALRLHFAEGFECLFEPGMRVFDVTVQGRPALAGFDPFAEAGGFARPVVMEVRGVPVQDGVLHIGFVAKVQSPAICGIEVFQTAPAEFGVSKLTTPHRELDVGRPDPARPVKKLLYIGNSHTFFWSMPETIAVMVNVGQKSLQLEPHKYLQYGKYLPWILDQDPQKGAIREIESGKYDFVIVQFSKPEDAAGVPSSLDRFGELIQKSGARMVIYVAQPPGEGEEGRKMLDAILATARKYDAVVVPCGLVYAATRSERPDLVWDNPDHVHFGFHRAYLNACTFYIAWTGQSPVGHPYPYLLKLGMKVDDAEARFLQEAAWQRYQEFKTKYDLHGAWEKP